MSLDEMKPIPENIDVLNIYKNNGSLTASNSTPRSSSIRTPPQSARSSRKPSSSSGDADRYEDLSEYYSVSSLTHRDETNDETFNSVRSRASLEDALWSDDEDNNDVTDLSTTQSTDVESSKCERMRLLAASQEYRLLLAKGVDMHKQGNTSDALRVFTKVLEAARKLNDPELQSQALTRLGLLYRRTYSQAEVAAGRIQRVFRGHIGRQEAR